MNRRAAGWVLGGALVLVLGGASWWWQQRHAGGRRGRGGHVEAAGGGVALETQAFDLYFPSSGGGLRAERRELKVTDAPKDRIRKVLEALLAGPAGAATPPGGSPAPHAAGAAAAHGGASASAPASHSEPPAADPGAHSGAATGATGATAAAAAAARTSGLVRPFPPEVKLGDVQLAADGTAFVDLRWPDHDDPPESGSTEEIQRIYSLVNTVAFNVPQANRVVVLWNGTQRLTFSGHLDTSRPLLPDRTLLAP
jgi:hypothetical protein